MRNIVTTSTFIASSLSLQVTRTIIKIWMSLHFGQIKQLITDPFIHFYTVVTDQILFKVADNKRFHIILDLFHFRSDLTTYNRVRCPLAHYTTLNTFNGANGVCTFLVRLCTYLRLFWLLYLLALRLAIDALWATGLNIYFFALLLQYVT